MWKSVMEETIMDRYPINHKEAIVVRKTKTFNKYDTSITVMGRTAAVGSCSEEKMLHASPVQLCCVNCKFPLDASNSVSSFQLPHEEVLSVHQVVELIFNGREVIDPFENKLKLCSTCGGLFYSVLKSYVKFLKCTTTGSYIYNLRNKDKKQFNQLKSNPQPIGKTTFVRLDAKDSCQSSPFSEDQMLRSTTNSIVGQKGRHPIEHFQKGSKTKPEDGSNKLDFWETYEAADVDESNPLTDPLALESDTEDKKINLSNLRKEGLAIRLADTAVVKMNLRKETAVGINSKTIEYKFEQLCASGEDPQQSPFEVNMGVCENGILDEAWNPDQTKKRKRKKPSISMPKRLKSDPVEYPEELKAMMEYTKYKCDSTDCVSNDVSFDGFHDWMIHQETVHELKTGYKEVKCTIGSVLKPKDKMVRPCPQCGKIFKTTETVKQHLMAVHLKIRPFSCDICHKTFSTSHATTNHKNVVHGTNDSNFLCTLCGRTFRSKGSLDLHEKIHFGFEQERKHECDICHLKLCTNRSLKRHKLIAHSEDRPLACDQCERTFKVESQLKEHYRRKHENLFNAVCEECGKAFQLKNSFYHHLARVHKIQKEKAREMAGICNREVFRVDTNGERTFVDKGKKPPPICTICDRTFARRKGLHLHVISAHGFTEDEATEITKFGVNL